MKIETLDALDETDAAPRISGTGLVDEDGRFYQMAGGVARRLLFER